jgi:glycosyltransferase involved in cell wall biosynthesis
MFCIQAILIAPYYEIMASTIVSCKLKSSIVGRTAVRPVSRNSLFKVTDPLLINLSFLSQKPTGLTTYAQNLFPQLHSLEPTLLVAKEISPYKYYPIPANINSDYGAKGHLKRLVWNQFQLPQIYQQLRSNLIFSPIPEAPLYSRCRFVTTVHDLIPLRFGKRYSRLSTYFRYYVPQVLKQAEHIITNSQSTAQEIMTYFGIPAHKITPILLAYDAANFRYLNLPTSNYFLYIGRPDLHKNLDRLISAFAALPNRQDYQLYLAGSKDDRYTPALKSQIESLGLTAQVKFLDYVPYADLPSLINRAIALVFPSLWEGFGLPALEAMACGTPVITSNLSALPEVTGDATILIDPYNVNAIASAMHEVANSGKLRSQLSQAGLKRAQHFSWETTGKLTAEILAGYMG